MRVWSGTKSIKWMNFYQNVGFSEKRGAGTREVFLYYMDKYKKRFKPFLEVGHTEAVKSVLRNKGAVSCLSIISVMNELNAVQLFRLKIQDFKFSRSFYTIWHKIQPLWTESP